MFDENDNYQYSKNEGPICPYCGHTHAPDEGFYYDETLMELDCNECERTFNVEVHRTTAWTTTKADREQTPHTTPSEGGEE